MDGEGGRRGGCVDGEGGRRGGCEGVTVMRCGDNGGSDGESEDNYCEEEEVASGGYDDEWEDERGRRVIIEPVSPYTIYSYLPYSVYHCIYRLLTKKFISKSIQAPSNQQPRKYHMTKEPYIRHRPSRSTTSRAHLVAR